MTRLNRVRRAGTLDLLAAVASVAMVAAGFAGWLAPGSDVRGILTWFIGCLLGSVLVMVPLAWLLGRIAFGLRGGARPDAIPAAAAHIILPTLFSGLLLVTFLPLILQFDAGEFAATSGLLPTGYLARWLFATAGLFGGSALIYAIRLARRRRLTPSRRDP